MPQTYEDYLDDYQVPADSRAKVNYYNGTVCPVDLSFGYIFGESPNRGEMKYEDDATPPIGKNILIQCGYHSYYGLVVRTVRDFDVSTGNCQSVSFVDMRDRLHDVIHYAQWNMTDDDKFRIFHIFPWDWKTQTRTYINQQEKEKIVKKIDQDTKKITKETISVIEQVPPFSAKSILNYLGETFNFKITATKPAMERLETYYPDNLDFNTGVKVINCISAIIDKLNLQFTCYGDLTVHITMKGVADNEFDKKLLAGVVDLCQLPGYKSASIGAELNERGRRVNIVGGRNRYEHWYPLYPAWNMYWDGDICLNHSLLSALLIKNNLTMIHKMFYLPSNYEGADIIYSGVATSDMSIRQYYENIPFKVFDADFTTPLYQFDNKFYTKNANANNNPKDITNYTLWTHKDNGNLPQEGYLDLEKRRNFDPRGFNLGKYYRIIDSKYPISAQTVSSYKDQFILFGTNRSFENKGADISRKVLQGTREELKDIANMEVNEILDFSQDDKYVLGRYKARFIFNKKMFKIDDPAEGEEYQFLPDDLFVCLSTDQEVYTFDVGDSYTSPRVRTIVKNVNDLFKSFFDDGSQTKADAFDTRNMFLADDNDYEIEIDKIAESIATMALLHEFISSSGNIVMKKSCGFLPTGIIESVAVTFDAKNGIQETINFSNSVNNEQTPVYRTDEGRTKANVKYKKGDIDKGEGKYDDNPLIKEALEALNRAGAGGPGGGNQAQALKPVEGNPEASFNGMHQAFAFGGLRNSAVAEINVDTFDGDKIRVGELLILDEPPA